jgi:F-type H+-transporting ATPase subunit delta
MKASHEQTRFVKSLVQLSLENGKVSGERVAAVLETLRTRPPRQLKPLLKEYLRRIRQEVARSTLVVESAATVSEETLQALVVWASSRTGRPMDVDARLNPDLIAGLRLQIADTVIEKNVSNDLNRLQLAI